MADQNEIVPLLSPGNDFAFIAKLWKPSGTGKAPLTGSDGAATAWISTDPSDDALADPVLTADVVYLNDATHPEFWRVEYNASSVKDAALRAVFSPLLVAAPQPTPWLVVLHAAGVRRVALLEYRDWDYFIVS